MTSATHPVVDIDSHLTEPPDLWTSRLPKKWGKLVPHVAPDPRSGRERWFVGDTKLPTVASTALAGWRDFPPSHPPTLAEADPAAWQAGPRLERMTEYGIHSQLLYPNLLGFQGTVFTSMGEQELGALCFSAYNDFLAEEFCSVDPKRLVPLMMLPFWDMDESLREMRRAHALGHRGIVFGANFQAVGLPGVKDDYWRPLYAQAQELGLPLNFHIGMSSNTLEDLKAMQRSIIANKDEFVRESALMMLSNSGAIADVILGGICHDFPQLNFVSVESGAGWVPFLLEPLDWQWLNCGARDALPQRLMPTEYFRRQIYGSFWFEKATLRTALELYPDNFMFETDFPHPTSLSPGPASYAPNPRSVVADLAATVPSDLLSKVLAENAVRVYRLD